MLVISDYSSSRTSARELFLFIALVSRYQLLLATWKSMHCFKSLHCLANKFQEQKYESLLFTILANYQSQVMLHITQLYISAFFVPEQEHFFVVVKLFVCRWRTPYCHRQYYSQGNFSMKKYMYYLCMWWLYPWCLYNYICAQHGKHGKHEQQLVTAVKANDS